ncbi:PLP-dependent aminotransferase family protein [Paenibacillus sp. Marseille-Q4541]|uniref:MocR-like pyridoxine biosynthesis transcription factor PdxR n=1 Tax=Paenibacillus sp. Marseille-Q4541 TaxID=2831522 RepID=UPI001BA8D151|nr:PLP-dependent aminotransferase family protein [Paenibacillus sp. Marseille-Q4541]
MEFTLPWEHYVAKYRYKYSALYHAIRDGILTGTLQSGSRLPATRELSKQYSISRGSAASAYDMLLADGYIVSEIGRGTYVAVVRKEDKHASGKPSQLPLSAWGKRVLDHQRRHGEIRGSLISSETAEKHPSDLLKSITDRKDDSIRFEKGDIPSTDFPYADWKKAVTAGMRDEEIAGSDPAGDYSLRVAIANHLGLSRGMAVEPELIVLFSGSMQGIALITQILLNEAERAVIENPGFTGFLQAVHVSGGEPVFAPVDEEGIIPADWDASLLYVTPSRHFPTGAVLPLSRRLEILSWAQKNNAVIIEDSYDSEFRFRGRPIEPLKVLDLEERVIYVGSFSKTMYPGFRLGYAVLPKGLIQAVLAAKTFYDPFPPGIYEQRGLAEWMSRGGYAKHVRKLTRIYGAKLNVFIEAMHEYTHDLFQLHVGDAGIKVYATWKQSRGDYVRFIEKCKQHQVYFTDSSRYEMTVGDTSAAYFGYVHLSNERIREGARRMADAWRDVRNKK